MTSLRRTACLVLALAAVTLVAACGSAASTAQSNPTATPTVAPTATATVAPTATATAAATAAAPVKTGSASVNGYSETILTTSNGMTLYYRTSDAPPSSVCSGGCAQAWPPLLFSGTPPAVAGLSGHLTTQMTANGSQVEYNGHPLYTYVGDSAPGQTTGEGVGGVWKVCTPGLA